jgi:sensor c-di-GMP phosphodiesterase-like protein
VGDNDLLVSQVHMALVNGEMYLEYLPTMSLQDKDRCVGGEALIRWRRNGETVMPLEFIPAIEGTSVAGLLTYWVIDTVAKELEDWLRVNSGVHISINVPPEILGRGSLEYAARKSRLIDVRNRIVLEITERGVPDKMGLNEIKQMAADHVLIGLDDVGLDDSNLLVLFQAPVDVLKIDKRLIDSIGVDQVDDSLHRLAPLIEASGRTVVAEGVERIEQAEFLRTLGIQMAQGWLYSKSLPAAEFIEWHSTHK